MHINRKLHLILICLVSILLMVILGGIREFIQQKNKTINKNTYFELTHDSSEEDPLTYIGDNFEVQEGFSSHLPIIILSTEESLSDYKGFHDSQEYVTGEQPYVNGHICILAGGERNYLSDDPTVESDLIVKKRGHTSYYFDKEQYLIKLRNTEGLSNPQDVLGMGEHDTWILNGSMADKSMIRNYLAYRTASQISEVTPDSQYCEVIWKKDNQYIYQGLYLMMESIDRDANRIPIDKHIEKNSYTSYIVRRDRFTNFDPMLDTYGRLEQGEEEWIGIKYPSAEKITDTVKNYIEEDFSNLEKIIYAENHSAFRLYDKYLDINSFVDYFLINEFFGNYDAGMHSTYMYKNSGEPLKIGPVWDFDQAMNNYYQDEMDPSTIAFQDKPIYWKLTKDKRFVELLQSRYAELQKGALNYENVVKTIDQTVKYIESARIREWYRWDADYSDASQSNWKNYYLQDYEEADGTIVSRFNTNYDQEIYNIKVYLYKHGRAMQTELQTLEKSTEYNTSLKNENELFLLIAMILLFVPSIMIIRKG